MLIESKKRDSTSYNFKVNSPKFISFLFSYSGSLLNYDNAAKSFWLDISKDSEFNDFFDKNHFEKIKQVNNTDNYIENYEINDQSYTFLACNYKDKKQIKVYLINKNENIDNSDDPIINQILINISMAISSTKSLQDLYKIIHNQLQFLFDVTNFYIAIYHADIDKYTFPYFIDACDQNTINDPITLDNTITDYVRKTNRPLLLKGDELEKFKNKNNIQINGTNPKVWMGSPLSMLDKVVGVIAVQGYSDQNIYSFKHLDLLQLISNIVALTIETKKSEVEMRESEEKFKILSDASQDSIILFDTPGKIVYHNKAFQELFGYEDDEIEELNFYELIQISEYNLSGYDKDLLTISNKVGNKVSELLGLKKSGEKFLAEVNISKTTKPNLSYSVAIIRDISKKHKEEKTFLDEVNYYISMINTVPLSIYFKDTKLRYLIANNMFCQSLNVSLEDVKGKTDFDIFDQKKAKRYQKEDLFVINNKEKLVKNIETKDKETGEKKWFSKIKVPIFNNDKIVGLIGLIQDVTEVHLGKEQLIQSDKLAAIGTLAAGVAHEINNPIGYINSNINTMKRYIESISVFIENKNFKKNENYEEILEQISDFNDALEESSIGIEKIKVIVKDLKSFSRIDKIEKENYDINEGIKTTMNMVWNELKYKCKVELNLSETPVICCFPNQLNQVFMNLLINAGQAIESNDGVIKITTTSDDENLYISIKDNGTGIEESSLNKIFEPFYTTKEVGQGTGLGLSLVYDIIRKHNGTIDVDSKLGIGTEFVITLPLNGHENE